MEKFKKFEVNNQNLVMGGELIMSITYSKSRGTSRSDLYDTETDRIIFTC